MEVQITKFGSVYATKQEYINIQKYNEATTIATTHSVQEVSS